MSSKDSSRAVWRTNDELTTYYVRRAAAAARQFPPTSAPSAFLLGLGVAMDDSNFVRDKPALNDVWQKIEPDDQRQARLLFLGTPTMLKRHSVTEAIHGFRRRWWCSAARKCAEAAGLGKEILDSRGGDSFSFADLARIWQE